MGRDIASIRSRRQRELGFNSATKSYVLYSRSTLLTRLDRNFNCSVRADYQVSRYKAQKVLGIRRCGCSSIRLPTFVLVRIRVIANPSNEKDGKLSIKPAASISKQSTFSSLPNRSLVVPCLIT